MPRYAKCLCDTSNNRYTRTFSSNNFSTSIFILHCNPFKRTPVIPEVYGNPRTLPSSKLHGIATTAMNNLPKHFTYAIYTQTVEQVCGEPSAKADFVALFILSMSLSCV